MKTVCEILGVSADFLKSRGVELARRSAEELLASILRLRRIDLYMQYDRPLIEEELVQMRGKLKELAAGRPLQYILGEVEFYGCAIQVDSRVLIPRPETEQLVDHICRSGWGDEGFPKTIWDLCAGSGCVGIALKKKFPSSSVVLSDLSRDALALAKENAQKNGVEVSFCQGDLLKPFVGQKADVIVCNPPYISEEEYLSLDISVKDFEPKMALVGKEAGFEFYFRLAQDLPAHLTRGGRVFLEIGSAQGEGVKEIFSSSFWVEQKLSQDWSGRNRFLFLTAS